MNPPETSNASPRLGLSDRGYEAFGVAVNLAFVRVDADLFVFLHQVPMGSRSRAWGFTAWDRHRNVAVAGRAVPDWGLIDAADGAEAALLVYRNREREAL